jgi:hypothetical protein
MKGGFMSNVVVYKNRTNTVLVNLGIDVSGDTFASEIRVDKNMTSTLIATWTVTFLTTGVDGRLKLVLDDSVTSVITQTVGYMDLKRTSNGEPLPVFATPVKVVFRETITA